MGGVRMIQKIPPGPVTMSDWNFVIVEYQGHVVEKFLGYYYELQHIRFSSQVIEYDPQSNTGKTWSGSKYFFLDRPGPLYPLAQIYLAHFSRNEGIRVRLKYQG